MRATHHFALLASLILASTAAVGPAGADITVLNRWILVNGDTLMRSNYYSQKRIRVTAPDGREYMFAAKGDTVTVIDHGLRKYWTGPRVHADSVARGIMAVNREGVPEMAVTDPVAWGERIEAFNKSIRIEPGHKQRKIAGYPTDLWIVSAGSYLHTEQWNARSLTFPNYGPELQKAILASIKDPLGRQLMRLIIDSKEGQGTALAGRTSFTTMTQGSPVDSLTTRHGSFEFEAQTVSNKKIPPSAWAIPAGYEQVVK